MLFTRDFLQPEEIGSSIRQTRVTSTERETLPSHLSFCCACSLMTPDESNPYASDDTLSLRPFENDAEEWFTCAILREGIHSDWARFRLEIKMPCVSLPSHSDDWSHSKRVIRSHRGRNLYKIFSKRETTISECYCDTLNHILSYLIL